MVISVRRDDGTGRPSSTALSSLTYLPGNPINDGWTTFLDLAFPSPAALAAGQVYFIVFDNVDAAPLTNFISINDLAVLGSVSSPRQPTVSDSDHGVLYSRYGSWQLDPAYTMVMDLTYGNGSHDGQGYIEAMGAMIGIVNGPSNMIREHFTISGGDRTVSSASIRIKRTAGSSPLTLRLETATGVLVDSATIPASSVPLTALGGFQFGSEWVTGTFASAHRLTNGATYNLRLITSSDTTYATVPIREGTDCGNAGGVGNPTGFRSDRFTDGDGQRTTNGGSTWSNMYLWSPVDLQFYLK
jgi:hypothetical protein